ncbi:hypothetical protein DAPPUDRAFT_325575 [Daphnia pulex]|uniref:Uncharacterized protein n=1 Tax=Daphnia pulex TaxID=6669 RepID=E9H558_DAPPU|nr:hypothetical protein DAPPUDRAFT_325575 [Daphnia pulex]|eukprot:EFX73073.1 hypothetical protein DAPPUDRAFT_325575 [Daphnia pulex]
MRKLCNGTTELEIASWDALKLLKDITRHSEIQLLLQGANLSAPCILSATALPPSKSLECMPAGGETPLNPMIFPEPSDYTGLAKVRQHATIPALAETNPEMAPEIIDEAPIGHRRSDSTTGPSGEKRQRN